LPKEKEQVPLDRLAFVLLCKLTVHDFLRNGYEPVAAADKHPYICEKNSLKLQTGDVTQSIDTNFNIHRFTPQA
jgi:hypothetical protein